MVVIQNERDMKNAPTKVLLQTAEDVVQGACSDSRIFDSHRDVKIPKFSSGEVYTGRIIGRGGFCTVKEITSIRSANKKRTFFQQRRPSNASANGRSTKSSHHSIDQSVSGVNMSVKDYMAYNCNKGGSPRYVIKQVAEEWVYQNRITYLKGTIDLGMEAKFLSNLQHPNIVELRGISEGGLFQEGSFLVLDRLSDTLPKKLKKWMTVDRSCKGITGAFVGGKKKMLNLMVDRLVTCYNVANALNYLHGLGIIYRDLKPDNIGFDNEGVVRIFDFGLAKELRDEMRTENGLYRLTGFTGSIRYMAPEVGLKKPYNQKADIYSFSMLLWYIMALEPPYGFYTPEMFLARVFKQGHRPVTMANWPENIAGMMKRCWDVRLNVRPNFTIIMEVLKKEVARFSVTEADKLAPYIP
mmetsp:Transcript_20421/g.29539  ORF Transcript_20421/g.29539 Transcript_20421/m.29539 type:complete len:411 (-) Transcript_20421:194-1426(-)